MPNNVFLRQNIPPMDTYKLTITRKATLVWFLLLYPIFSLILFMGGLLMFGDFFEQSKLTFPAVLSYFILLLITSMIIVRRYIVLPITITVSDEGLALNLNKRNMFYQFNRLTCGWNNVANLSKNYDSANKKHFISLSLKEPNVTYLLSAKSTKDLDEAWDDFNRRIKSHDIKAAPTVDIKERSFYAGPWMRLLAYAGICMLLAFMGILIFSPDFRSNTTNILKLLSFSVFLILFLINYFTIHKKENIK